MRLRLHTKGRRVAAIAAAAVLATACGSSGSDDTGSTSDDAQATDDADGADDPASGDVVELDMLAGFTGGDRAAYEGIVERFNAEHDDIQVSLDIQPWDTIGQTLPSAWGTGSGPDIATPNFDPAIMFRYVKDELALPLDDVLGDGDNQIDPNVVPQFVTDAFTIDGTLYAVPANVATLQLYYNRQLLSDAGLDGPPETSEELEQAALDLTADGTYGISLADRETIQMWPLLLWMNGGDVLADGCSALDDPATIDAFETWSALVEDQGVSPVGQSGAESDSLFAAGQAALQMNGPWAAAGYRDAGIDFGVAPIPSGPDGQVTLASTVPLMVSAATEHPAEAQEFLAFWNSADVQREFALASGFPPTRTDLADDPDLAENETVAQFASALPDARLYLPGVAEAAAVDGDVFVPLVESITRGADVTEAAADASAAANDILGCG